MTFEQMLQGATVVELVQLCSQAQISIPGFASRPNRAPRVLLMKLLTKDERTLTAAKEAWLHRYEQEHGDLLEEARAVTRLAAEDGEVPFEWLKEKQATLADVEFRKLRLAALELVAGFDEQVLTEERWQQLRETAAAEAPAQAAMLMAAAAQESDDPTESTVERQHAKQKLKSDDVKEPKLRAQVKTLQQEAKQLRQEKRALEKEVRTLTVREQQLRAELTRHKALGTVEQLLQQEFPFPAERLRRMAQALFEANRELEETRVLVDRLQAVAASSMMPDGESKT